MRIAAQSFTIRRELEADPAAALAGLRASGFDALELAGTSGRSATQLAGALRAADVTPIAMHVSLERLRKSRAQVLDDASVLDLGQLVVPSLADDQAGWTLADYDRAAAELDELAADLAQDGLRLHFHNHATELTALESQRPLDVLLRGTSPSLGFELDVGWLRVASEDPSEWLRRAAGRLVLVHLKDVELAADSHSFRPLGDGVIDWRAVFDACIEAGVEWGIVEDDDALVGPFASLERSRAHLEALGVLS